MVYEEISWCVPVVHRVPGVQDLEEQGERLHADVEAHHVHQLVHGLCGADSDRIVIRKCNWEFNTRCLH